MGLQAVSEDDRRILDYSELITSLEDGAGKKFTELISRYVDGNVKSTVDDVHEAYARSYPRKSTERLIPKTWTVPLSLNETQKRILTAVENEKNQIIVVDGPPGTGKSYTITALVYLTNQLGKSAVVTSHKKQALDVIDQALIEQFKILHPRSKPAVLRLENPRGPASLNTIQNTLSNPVINAAKNRSGQTNYDAVVHDRKHLFENIQMENERFWDAAIEYEQMTHKTLEWVGALEALLGRAPENEEEIPPKIPEKSPIDIERIRRLTAKIQSNEVSLSVEALNSLFQQRDRFPSILEKCEQLNKICETISSEELTKVSSVPPELSEFLELIQDISQCVVIDTPLREIDAEDLDLQFPEELNSCPFSSYSELLDANERFSRLLELEKKFLGKLFKNKEITKSKQTLKLDFPWLAEQCERESTHAIVEKLDAITSFVENAHSQLSFLQKDYIINRISNIDLSMLKQKIYQLSSLEFQTITSLIAQLNNEKLSDLSIRQIIEQTKFLDSVNEYNQLRESVEPFADQAGVNINDLPKLYNKLKKTYDVLILLDEEDILSLTSIFDYFEPLFNAIAIDGSDLSSLVRFTTDPARAEKLFRFMHLHCDLSTEPQVVPPEKEKINEYLRKTHKLLEHNTDSRFGNLLHHAADVQRVQTAIGAGKRITKEQAQVLLNHLSCVISEPGLIARHFPMEADLIDLLIIDEASQVSIAESISLMLRAKQTVIFGDELQYGAVGAVNVSQKYSEYFFKDIIRDYSRDRDQVISEEESDRIAREASIIPDEEEEESSHVIPVSAGTREWLKTFSVRTSTLAFAKALNNYSASLDVHFRSFPEIISYSNDHFYKESQIELITNRIRTKPIGEVLRFLKVETKGLSGKNVNLDEIEAIQGDLEAIIQGGYEGSIGVICSFREQTARMEEFFRKELKIYPELVRNHRFKVWFVGDVQGEERDLIYYSFVQDKKLDNADLRTIYPIIGGTADNIRRTKMQRLNVGFSRAKDIMVFVHSMPIKDYSDTRLGDALRHYEKVLNSAQDLYVEDEGVFDSPAEKELYSLICQTPFFQQNRERLRLIAQFEIGKYIREEYHRNIPRYRVDFLLTLSYGGKEKSLIIEYDGVEFHTKNPDIVTRHNIDQEYLEYDAERQLELESYGYSFLRINKFSLLPRGDLKIRVAILNHLLEGCFSEYTVPRSEA